MDLNYIDIIIKKENLIEFYEMFRNNNDALIPNSFWTSTNGRYRAKVIVRHLIEDILKLERRVKVIRNLTTKDFKNNKLQDMLDILFSGSVFLAVDNAYPGMYKECMFKGKRFYWDIDLIKEELEIIATENGKTERELRIRDINKADFVGGERVFRRMFGSFENFMSIYYPQEHWWIPRTGKGSKRTTWTMAQEKEAVRYVLSDKLGIDVDNTKSQVHINVRDFYKEHMRFLCEKYDYSVQRLIHAHYPDLKVYNHLSGNYILVSPTGQQIEISNIPLWVEENRDLFPVEIKNKTIITALTAISNPHNKYHSYHGWTCRKV